jgi:hypothetical protein
MPDASGLGGDFLLPTPTAAGLGKPVITGAGNPTAPTGEDIRISQNGAQTATQSDMGAELGESPGHASEVEAFD